MSAASINSQDKVKQMPCIAAMQGFVRNGGRSWNGSTSPTVESGLVWETLDEEIELEPGAEMRTKSMKHCDARVSVVFEALIGL